MYEVELKFPLADPRDVLSRLTEWGASSGDAVEQYDLYFRHPARDFVQTDEALRLRTVGSANCVTYKGPVVDDRTKTRREIEVPLAEGSASAERFVEILVALGFESVRSVRKRRTVRRLNWRNREFEIALDEVADLGTFLEIETLADDASRSAARDAILAVAKRLGMSNPERTSYLGLLLAKDRQNS
jgi:adenylate cyclase class 2